MLSRLTTRRGSRLALFATGAMLAVGTAANPVAGSEAGCTKLIGGQIRGIMKTGQKDQIKCHSTANKICVGSDPCNDPDEVAFQILDKGKLEGKKSGALVKVSEPGGECSTGPLSIARFPGGALSNSLELFDDLLANRGTVLLGDTDLGCDPEEVKCFATVAKNRANLADKMLKAAAACAEAAPTVALDLSSTCITTAETELADAVIGANDKINAVCGDLGITGADIGTCTPLPACATEGGIAEGKAAALRAFPDSDCSPVLGTRTAAVTVNTDTPLDGVEVEFDYPNVSMAIPANGDDASIASRFIAAGPAVSGINYNDLDSRFRVVVSGMGITSGQLVDLSFDSCVPLKLGSCADDAGPSGARACDTENDCKVCQNVCPSGSQFSGETCVVTADCGTPPGSGCPVTGSVGANCDDQSDCTGGTVCSAGVTSDAPCNITAQNGQCSFSNFEKCEADAAGSCPTGETCQSASALVPCTVTAASDSIGNAIAGVTCAVTLSEP